MTLDDLRATAEPGRGGYRVFGGEYAQMSVTLEDAEFLYALIRLMKPSRVLEIGAGLGVSGRFIVGALVENGSGWLDTVEPDRNLWPALDSMFSPEDLPIDLWADVPYEELTGETIVDLLFIDSGYDRREADIAEWLTNGYRGLLVVHDGNRDYEDLRGRGVLIPCTDGMWIGRGGGS